MTPLVPVAVKHPAALIRRAAEYERFQHRIMFSALLFSILVHGVVVSSFYLIPSVQSPVDMSRATWNRTRPPHAVVTVSIMEHAPPGPSATSLPVPANVRDGIPEPVPDQEAPRISLPEPVEPSQSPYGSTGEPGSGNGVDRKTGGAQPGIPPPDAGPDPFVSVERNPVFVKRVAPRYPDLLQRAGIEGLVIIRIWVDRDGKPHQVQIVKGDNELFNNAAVEAAKQFVFTPAYMNNGPVPVWVTVPFRFSLR